MMNAESKLLSLTAAQLAELDATLTLRLPVEPTPPEDAMDVFAWHGEGLPPNYPQASHGCYYWTEIALYYHGHCPYPPGAKLGVQEAYYDRADYAIIAKARPDRIVYVADGKKSGWLEHPASEMPAWAVRRWYIVRTARMERDGAGWVWKLGVEKQA